MTASHRGVHPEQLARAAVAPAGREAPAPQRLRMAQGVPPNARQQWAEAYTVVGHKVLDACANAHGAGARADVLQVVQEFGALARTVFAHSRSRRSGAAAAWRAYWRACATWQWSSAGKTSRSASITSWLAKRPMKKAVCDASLQMPLMSFTARTSTAVMAPRMDGRHNSIP